MINDKEEIINTLQLNIQHLKSLYEEEKKKCLIFSREKAELLDKFKQKDQEYHSLEARLDTLKMAKTLTGNNNDVLDAKSKVTNLVREIDKCISLLNR